MASGVPAPPWRVLDSSLPVKTLHQVMKPSAPPATKLTPLDVNAATVSCLVQPVRCCFDFLLAESRNSTFDGLKAATMPKSEETICFKGPGTSSDHVVRSSLEPEQGLEPLRPMGSRLLNQLLANRIIRCSKDEVR